MRIDRLICIHQHHIDDRCFIDFGELACTCIRSSRARMSGWSFLGGGFCNSDAIAHPIASRFLLGTVSRLALLATFTTSIDCSSRQQHIRNTYLSEPPTPAINMFRQAAIRNARLFSTSVTLRKSPVESAADAAKTVDKTISQNIVKGIEKTGTSTSLLQLHAWRCITSR